MDGYYSCLGEPAGDVVLVLVYICTSPTTILQPAQRPSFTHNWLQFANKAKCEVLPVSVWWWRQLVYASPSHTCVYLRLSSPPPPLLLQCASISVYPALACSHVCVYQSIPSLLPLLLLPCVCISVHPLLILLVGCGFSLLFAIPCP